MSSETEVQSFMVHVPGAEPDRTMHAYQALPAGTGPFPGIIVIHEIFGLNDNIRDIAQRFAREGYAALAVDLFSTGNRFTCMMQIMYGMLIRPLDNRMLADLGAALNFWSRQQGIDPQRLGVVGFCMGGTYALQLACVDDRLEGASVFYGQNPRPLEAVAQACPIVGSYPEKDFTAKAARELDQALDKFQVPHDIKIYPNAHHTFFNDQGSAFDPQASSDAWQRMLSFFGQYLADKTVGSS